MEHDDRTVSSAPPVSRRGVLLGLTATALAPLLAACSSGGFPEFGRTSGTPVPDAPPATSGESFGSGPVRVALLLPLSGDEALATVGMSMANAARLAMEAIEANPSIPANITVLLKDTGTTSAGATQAASLAAQEGASLILGPLRADQVTAAGAVARAAGIPVIAFSNNTGAAGPGVYLLNVLPETEVRRTLAFAKDRGRRAFAGIFPSTDFGRIQQGAFRQAAADLELNVRAASEFSSEAEAREVVAQLAPLMQQGAIDVLFLPDRATAPSFAVLLEEAGVPPGGIQIVGSADWNGDAAVSSTPYLTGAIYPAVDENGFATLLPEYQTRFGHRPHPFATIGYTAITLANASSLALATPRYDRAQLTVRNGFSGRDGAFRFYADGRSDYALTIKQVTLGGATLLEGPRLL